MASAKTSTSQRLENSEDADETVRMARQTAIEMMRKAGYDIGTKVGLRDYQQKIVHDLLNDIQDLYADDISFKVLRNSPIMASDQMTRFLQDWVKDEPAKTRDPAMDGWVNASIMAHNARALAQM